MCCWRYDVVAEAVAEKLARKVGDLLTNDKQFVTALPDKQVCESMLAPGLGLAGIIRTVAEGYADRPAFGQRATRLDTAADGRGQVLEILPRFDMVTYGQLWQQARGLAAALASDGLHEGDRVAVLGFCSVEYTAVEMAIASLGCASVPLHAGAPVGVLAEMVEEAEPRVIACSTAYLDAGVRLALGAASLARLIVFDYRPDLNDHTATLESGRARIGEARSSVALETFTEVVERGQGFAPLALPTSDDKRLSAIVYTSGSSGKPKGAMLPEGLVGGAWSQAATMMVERNFALPAITLNYLPMSHTGGRSMLFATLGAGGTAYLAGSTDFSTLLEDLSLVRPTQLNYVPRVWELLYREFVSECSRRDHATAPSSDIEEEVLADLRTRVLGGRYVTALSGSAPISAELAAWVERLLDSPLMDALGATESGPVILDGKVPCPPVTDYKIVDVADLGYFATDRPYPRGEMLIKSKTLFGGYYKRPDLTAEVFDEDGFYRTGDVFAQLGPDEFRFVDRRNNVLKLSQGEFVTISRLEAVFANCDPVRQVYVYGNGERSFLLAVVVPTDEAMAGNDVDALKPHILRTLQRAARAAELQSYEVPRDIIVETTPFTVDNGLLTGTGKLSRPNLKRIYGERLERLYAELADAQHDRLRELRELVSSQPTTDTVCAAAGALLGSIGSAPAPDVHFTELGGDSLSALTFADALEDIFGVEVPVGVIISPSSDLQGIADYVNAQQETDSDRPTFASVHGAGSTTVCASDLTLDKFIDVATLAHAPTLPGPPANISTVLLTGATGYLGRYLLLDWLHRVKGSGGKVICLVRAKDDAAARARLDAVFDSGDTKLLDDYQRLAADHLEVLAGDKNSPELGLDHPGWQRLADTVDLIVDPAALVNHMLPYHQLFGPNVVGTAELIRLALTTRQKAFAYVSSVGVGVTVDPSEFVEDADVRKMSVTRTVDNSYASGYATSKWAAEVLLREAHDLCGLPVTVFRSDMIMAAPGYGGQLNVPDMVTRLILSIAATGLAPESFYIHAADGKRSPSHFDGLPVDFVAESISTLGVKAESGFQTFHVVNPHDDGIGFDDYVDWMAEAGCRIERINGYDEWYARFETAVRNLPERQRQASLLPLLQNYRHPLPPTRGTFAPAEQFSAAVKAAGLGRDGEIPQIDKYVIEKYLDGLELLGLLEKR
ncbi:MAG: carboxylic acid reductase [Mycobacterium sp.]